ncbi:MAG: ankyrin repeat domain-containing protein [Rickettsiales bacterium]|jgi:hypothetical protein|nr:ankyrin repeat domain-containing protein [Rickettsiales bacterium]
MTSDALNSNDVLMKKAAAVAGDINSLDSLWEESPTTVKQKALILNEAILNNQVATVRFLLEEKNVDPNTKFAGTTALFWANQRGNSEIIELLSKDYTKKEIVINETAVEAEQELSLESETVTFETSADYSSYVPYAFLVVGIASLGALHQISLHKNSYDAPNPFGGALTAFGSAISSYVSSFNPFSAAPKVTIAAATVATKVIEELEETEIPESSYINLGAELETQQAFVNAQKVLEDLFLNRAGNSQELLGQTEEDFVLVEGV